MRKFLSLLLLSCAVMAMFAVPAKRMSYPVTLADGQATTATRVGDEFFRCLVGPDGRVLRSNNDGTFSYATESHAALRARAINNRPRARRKSIGTPKALPKILVVLVNFTDQKWNSTYATKAGDQLNLEGYNYGKNIGSVKDYFIDASNGQYAPEFDVYGPMTLAHNMEYYGGNDDYYDEDQNPQAMILEAAQYVHNLGVDLSQYDSDGDGAVDFFTVWYAGYSEAEDDVDFWTGESKHPYLVWPHQWELSDPDANVSQAERTFGGTQIDSYFVMSELSGQMGSSTSFGGIGTFCHEFSHALGLPDFYDTSDSDYGNEATMREWDVMDYGPYNGDGCVPPTYSAYERYFMGWMTPVVLNASCNDTLSHILTANEARMISPNGTLLAPHPSQPYLMLENRQPTRWDAKLPGHGLMITKITYSKSTWDNNSVNNSRSSMGVDLMEARTNNSAYGAATDLFPQGATSYNPTSPLSGNPITAITELADGRVAFKFRGGASNTGDPSDDPTDPTDPTGDCFEETFAGVAEVAAANGYDVTQKLDMYLDNEGWTGLKIFAVSDNAGVRVGASKSAGSITTPELGIACSTMLVSFVYSNYDAGAGVSISISGGGSLSDIELVEDGNSYATINNATAATKLTFSTTGTNKKRFFLRNVTACSMDAPDAPSALPVVEVPAIAHSISGGLQLLTNEPVTVLTTLGQTVYTGTGAKAVSMPAGVYVVRTAGTAQKVIVK